MPDPLVRVIWPKEDVPMPDPSVSSNEEECATCSVAIQGEAFHHERFSGVRTSRIQYARGLEFPGVVVIFQLAK